MQHIPQSGATENIDLKDTWFNPDLEEYTRENPRHEPSVVTDNNNKPLTSPQYEPHAQEIPASKGAYAYNLHELPAYKGVWNR